MLIDVGVGGGKEELPIVAISNEPALNICYSFIVLFV